MQKNILCKTVINWDYIIITVNNYKQKEFAEKEILKRRKLKYISKETKVIIRVAPKGFETGATLIKMLKKLKLNGKRFYIFLLLENHKEHYIISRKVNYG